MPWLLTTRKNYSVEASGKLCWPLLSYTNLFPFNIGKHLFIWSNGLASSPRGERQINIRDLLNVTYCCLKILSPENEWAVPQYLFCSLSVVFQLDMLGNPERVWGSRPKTQPEPTGNLGTYCPKLVPFVFLIKSGAVKGGYWFPWQGYHPKRKCWANFSAAAFTARWQYLYLPFHVVPLCRGISSLLKVVKLPCGS